MPGFFEQPVLNSPYRYPERHWELDETGQPTRNVLAGRRGAKFVTPVPAPRKDASEQERLELRDAAGVSADGQQYADVAELIGGVRRAVDAWRALPNPRDWGVTPETQRLLRHWREHEFTGARPFFCQREAVETIIWLSEVAPKLGRNAEGRRFLRHLDAANAEANPELARRALKLATGAGKTTVMAMIIAWQTVNALRRPGSRQFTRGFLVVAPGITIKDRLRVLQPNDPDSYYRSRELVPHDMLPDLEKARIVITNFHALRPRETLELSRGGKALLRGRGSAPDTMESEGQMVRRVMPALMGLRDVLVLNDEGHHCYRHKQEDEDERALEAEERREAQENEEAARVWISGLEMVKAQLGLQQVIDLSATPFFLRGSGYAEGTLFPWTVSDFSLMDAIECGIVKLPRVPVADNVPDPAADMPKLRALWENIRGEMPRAGRRKAGALDPSRLPVMLQTALEALYGHYERTFELWREADIPVHPCFIVVCNNTASSKLVYDYIAGHEREGEDGSRRHVPGKLPLFRNHDEAGAPLPRPRTLLIDSSQLESGEALDADFRKAAAAEIARFRDELRRRGAHDRAANLSDEDLLRETMNTVGKEGQLGEGIRCVVSVSMLTEGWDANTVTHILGVRAFGTQLLCEQVIGRALRRQSYELNEEGLFPVEYADVLGVPFDFTASAVVAPPAPPRRAVLVRAVSPERDHLEIRFPNVRGYRVELPDARIEARFTDDSTLRLTPEVTGPTLTRNEGIIGQGVDLGVAHLEDVRRATVAMHLTAHLIERTYRDADGEPEVHLYGRLRPIVERWLGECLRCEGGTHPAQLLHAALADDACERIAAAITRAHEGERPVRALLDAYNPEGSTAHVHFTTTKRTRWRTDPARCHVDWAVMDNSEWEGQFCRAVERHPRVLAWVKNNGLGFEVPWRDGRGAHRYLPDFIVRVDDGRGPDDPLNLVVEIKGRRDEDAKAKKDALETYWIPGVNNLERFGRWASVELSDVWRIEEGLAEAIDGVSGE